MVDDHGLGTNYQRERSAQLAVRGFVEAVARRGKGRLNEFRTTVLTKQFSQAVACLCRLVEQTG